MPKSLTKRILVSPLEWGLGHATRLSAIIELLLSDGHTVIIAADGLPYNFLQKQFPKLTIERLPIKQIRYSQKRRGFFLKLFAQIPGFFISVRRSRKAINELVRKHEIDLIISDNRYGFLHPDKPSVFITHQLRPMPPRPWRWAQSLFGHLHLWLLRKYTFIWVADYNSDVNVAGKLSHIPWTNSRIKYIGPLSWLKNQANSIAESAEDYDLLVMLSGPEPHRSILEAKLLTELKPIKDLKVIFLQGLPRKQDEESKDFQIESIRVVNHLPGKEIYHLIKNTPKIICRAGVVTVFDLAVLQKPALLIPTSGQTEQEYVANYLDRKGYFRYLDEKDITQERILSFNPLNLKKFPNNSGEKLNQAIREFLQQE